MPSSNQIPAGGIPRRYSAIDLPPAAAAISRFARSDV